MTDPVTGYECKLYVNEGTHGTPSLTLIDDAADVNLSGLAWSLAELKRRKSRWVKNLPTSISASLEFGMPHGLDASVFDTLRAAFFARTVLEFWVLDGAEATTGTEGLRMWCIISEFPWNQSLEDVSSHDFTVVPTFFEESSTEQDPSWVVVS